MTVLDLELTPATAKKLAALSHEAADEWVRADVPDGTAARTMAGLVAAGLDREALAPGGSAQHAEIVMGLATVFPAAAVVFVMHSAVLHLAVSSANEAQRSRIFADGKIWGFGAAPPADGPRARVESTSDGPVLNGALRRVSGAGVIDGLAALVPYGDKSAILLVETARPGVRIEPAWQGSGLRASSTRQIHFDRVAVRREDVVALVESANELPSWETAMLGLAAVCAGMARRAALEALERLRDARFGPSVERNSRHELARVLEEATAAMAVARALAARTGRPTVDPVQILGAKMATAAMAERAVHAARAVVGMDGFEAPHPLERLSRDVLAVRHFFPVEPVALDLFLGELSATARGGGGSPGRRS